MFTGLVQAVGRIEQVEPRERGLHLVVHAGALDPSHLRVGDSVAVSGCCLTATSVEGARFQVDVSEETLSRTVNLDRCGDVNLELSLALGDRLGGHLMSGHVDAVGTVVSLSPVGQSSELVVRAPRSLAAYLAFKGSLAVDGVSLTINRVEDTHDACEAWINLIPHTRAVTTLGQLEAGRRVNLEVDLLARYAERIVSVMAPAVGKRT
jgi:riboflavin synthase